MPNDKIHEDAGSFSIEKDLPFLFINKPAQTTPNTVVSVFYGKNQIKKLLDTNGCVGIRIFFGEDNGTHKVSLTAADKTKKVLKPDNTGLKSPNDAHLSNGPECPSTCGV